MNGSAIIGQSPQINQVKQLVNRISRLSEVAVLIRGETGTGKEVVARAIHDATVTDDALFVEMNCAGIPEQLLESELFGYEKGAYTGADRTKKGMLEMAHRGTLLLDEIGDMSMRLQAKLLKAVEEKSFRRLGGEKVIQVKTRIIASTNVDLEKAIQEGNFREDPYYRLNEIQLDLPPLRARNGDAVLLAKHFMEEFSVQYQLTDRRLAPTAQELLTQYNWPGNVRELRNAIKRAMIMNDVPEITADMIPVSIRSSNSLAAQVSGGRNLVIEIPDEGIAYDDMERLIIDSMLDLTAGNKNRTARMLRISYPRLLRKIAKYELVERNPRAKTV
jgi:transcriptional regulator with PAS, ATPase and Fis domain